MLASRTRILRIPAVNTGSSPLSTPRFVGHSGSVRWPRFGVAASPQRPNRWTPYKDILHRRPILSLLATVFSLLAFQGRSATDATPASPQARVYRDKVQAEWFGDNTRFWYRVETGPRSHEFVMVNPEAGSRTPAFDHQRLATALTQAGVPEASAERLPLSRLEFHTNLSSVRFRAGGRTWDCNLNEYQLSVAAEPGTNGAAPLAQVRVPGRSTRTGDESSLTFYNRTPEEVELFWVDTEGNRRSYGKLAAGESREQHTFEGHVWVAVGRDGKTIRSFEAAQAPSDADIINVPNQPAPNRPERIRNSSRRQSDLSPDSKWRAVFRDSNVFLENAQSGESTALSKDGTADDAYSGRIYWSPDSQRVVVLRTAKGQDRKVTVVESSPKDQLQPRVITFDYDKPGDRLPISKPHLFEVAGRREIPIRDDLFPNPWSLDRVRWIPDSSEFTFLYNQRGHQVLRVVGINATNGETRAIIDERSETFINYSGNLFYQMQDDTGEIIWMSERDGWNHLYLYDARAGKVKNQITKGQWVVRGVDQVDTEKRQIWFRAGGLREGQDPYYIHYCRVNFDGSNLTVLTEGDGTHRIQFSPNRQYFIDTWSRVDLAPVHELRRSRDGSLVCQLEKGDDRDLLAARWRAPERFTAKGRDGVTDIYGIIHWPANYDPTRKYPVIESIYAGPQDSFVPKAFSPRRGHSALSDRGFIVVQIDGMGTANRSKKFHDVCWKNLADAGLPDRILWMKAAAAKFPALDLERVGVYGTSAGGQSALGALLFHGDFYKAGIADCGCHDNRMDKVWWNEQWMGWPVGPEYAENSNVTHAHKLKGKLLLMVGEIDRNVDPASTLQVADALIKANKDFELIVLPGVGHGTLGTEFGRKRMLEFFTRHLQPPGS